MKLLELLNIIENKNKFDPQPILQKLKTDLQKIGIQDPSFQGGFCFHAAARIYDALREKDQSSDLKLYHKHGHVFVYNQDKDICFDSNGEHMGDDPFGTRGRVDHRWKNPEVMIKFLKANEDSMSPESFKGLQVIEQT